MSTSHPWRIEAASNIPDAPCCVVDVSYHPNARLIAAAPDLLAALQEIAETHTVDRCSPQSLERTLCDLRAIARAAIAKATL